MRPVTYDYGAAQSGEPSREQTDQSRANIVIPVRSSLVLKLVDCACLGPTQIGEENLKGVSLSYLSIHPVRLAFVFDTVPTLVGSLRQQNTEKGIGKRFDYRAVPSHFKVWHQSKARERCRKLSSCFGPSTPKRHAAAVVAEAGTTSVPKCASVKDPLTSSTRLALMLR